MRKKSMIFLVVMVLALALPAFANTIKISAQGYEFSAAEKKEILIYFSPKNCLNSDKVAEVHIQVSHQSDGKHLVKATIKDKDKRIYTAQWVYIASISVRNAVQDAIAVIVLKRNSTLREELGKN